MANGTINLGQSGSILGQIIWSSSSNGTSANSSQVTASIQCRKASNTTQPTRGTWTGNLNVGGTNQGISWNTSIGTSWVTLKEFTITKSHNQDGTGTCYIQGSINGPSGTTQSGKTVSGEQTVTLDKIDRWATITEAPDFNDTQNPTINFYNPAGFKLMLKIEAGGNDSLIIRDNISESNSYTFTLTEAERNKLRALTPNSNTLPVRFTVGTYLNGSVQNWSYLDKTMTIVNANPTFDVAYLDTNSKTTDITGNNQLIIQNNSTLQVKVTNATSYKYAELRNISVNVNGNKISQFPSSSSLNIDVGILDVSQNLTIPVTLTDSRGNSTTKNLTVKILEWKLPTALISMQRVSNYYSTTNIKVDASFSSLNNKNEVTIQYQTKKRSDISYGALTTIQNNQETTFEADNNYEWDIKVLLTDKFGTTSYYLILGKGIPIAFFDARLNATGFNCFPQMPNSTWVNNIPVDDAILIGTQPLYDYSKMTSSGTTSLLGAYNYWLLGGIFDNTAIPIGYERAYKISAQISTSGSNTGKIILNNIESSATSTWSGSTFRKIVSTRIFKESELKFEDVFNFETDTRKGLNLKISNEGSGTLEVWNIALHAYLVKKTTEIETMNNFIKPSYDRMFNEISRIVWGQVAKDYASIVSQYNTKFETTNDEIFEKYLSMPNLSQEIDSGVKTTYTGEFKLMEPDYTTLYKKWYYTADYISGIVTLEEF